jgi:DedD protein
MSFLFDTQEEKETPRSHRYTPTPSRAADNDTEIALGTRSLLAIFFGLVLVCAIFFGLGYSVGRGSGTRAAAPPIDASTPPDSHLSKPSPEQTLTPVETPPPATDSGSAAAPASDDTPAPQANTPIRTPTSAPSASPAPSPAIGSQNPARAPVAPPAARPGAALQPAAATLTTAFVVQVAAVRVPQDAEILVDALKKRGYTAAARNEPQDQLLHIQLGPFTSRTDAMAMRAKLLSDGYNAVIK